MEPLLARLSVALPAPARQHLTAPRMALLAQFIRFGMVGTAGFVTNTATVYALRGWAGLYAAGLVAYAIAATVTWALNRVWTFRHHAPSAPVHHQWALFLVANGIGFALNYGIYVALVTWSPLCQAVPVLPIAAGALAGMFVNFAMSRQLVFR